MNIKTREDLKWESSKESYGTTIEEIKAEFQCQNLSSLRSNPIKYKKIKIGTVYTYQCKVEACDFYARVSIDLAPESVPVVETASNHLNFPI